MADLVRGLGGPAGFGERQLPANDDQSSDAINITRVFEDGLNFFGTTYNSLYINNNGNVTFEAPLATYTPFGITNSDIPIIAAFFADVDTLGDETGLGPTRGGTSQGTDTVWYDLDPASGKLTVTWDDVGFYAANLSERNAFQLELIDKGDGDFDIVFRYEDIQWTRGEVSDADARIGYSAGDQRNHSELDVSGDRGALLELPDSPGLGSPVAGEVVYHVRNGVVIDPGEPVDPGEPGEPGEDDEPAGGRGIIEPVVHEGVRLVGDRGEDSLVGGRGNDSLIGAAGGDTLFGRDGDDVLKGGAGRDALDGGDGDDKLFGHGGADRLVGAEGDDTINGGSDNDFLFGRDGNDVLRGGRGDDLIVGGGGRDVVAGGGGEDTFVLTPGPGQSRVLDFTAHVDVFGLDNGLTFDDISFDGHKIMAGDAVLAVVVGFDTTTLTEADFVIL
ncbi:hypothetical protein DLJ53_06925 [Acuticoccus sediminis]|uniref:NIDO domain-containing protein n=1 Tax=Acuticoccus sediminis TaxID=2184697 RepID=A0A8B2P2K5_9HYPH|nr:nidogen-like domain-containing protein [Acuticoccus sediminis]RAI04174.1 hypothetical protein DLJ53_06925 [Acuticoccus sediminis]